MISIFPSLLIPGRSRPFQYANSWMVSKEHQQLLWKSWKPAGGIGSTGIFNREHGLWRVGKGGYTNETQRLHNIVQNAGLEIGYCYFNHFPVLYLGMQWRMTAVTSKSVICIHSVCHVWSQGRPKCKPGMLSLILDTLTRIFLIWHDF